MRIVVALGGNALVQRGQPPDYTVQFANTQAAVASLRELALKHQLIIVHGNGPQVGMLALESTYDRELTSPYPLDVLVAETQGMIGYLLVNALNSMIPERTVVTLCTRTVVDPEDPAFSKPTKFIGPRYQKNQADRLSTERGWVFNQDGQQWRRVVPSPDPQEIMEISSIRCALTDNTIVIAGGGGGAPVCLGSSHDPSGVRGVEAIVDKDLTAALLADQLDADVLLILTDVDGVYRDFYGDDPRRISQAHINELMSMSFPEGSMAPKVEACRRFLTKSERVAVIGSLVHAADSLYGRAGTYITQ